MNTFVTNHPDSFEVNSDDIVNKIQDGLKNRGIMLVDGEYDFLEYKLRYSAKLTDESGEDIKLHNNEPMYINITSPVEDECKCELYISEKLNIPNYLDERLKFHWFKVRGANYDAEVGRIQAIIEAFCIY